MTVLLTTHYIYEAEQACDRVALMHRGQIRALGTPRELIDGLGPGPTATSTTSSGAYSGDPADEDAGRDPRCPVAARRTASRLG